MEKQEKLQIRLLKKKAQVVLYLLIISISFGTLFVSSSAFIDAQILPKWYAFIYCILLGSVYLSVRFIFYPFQVSIRKKQIIKYLWIIYLFCALQALYGIVQYLGILPSSGFRIIGSFDNPAGFAASICAGFPICFVLMEQGKNKVRNIAVLLCASAIIISIALSESRAGILSISGITLIYFWKKIPVLKHWKVAIFTFLFLIFFTGLYFIKKDSANGRVLIWQCSWNMILDKPLSGHGCGGFKANYMDYQAAFFRENPQSKYSALADTVQHPFNEYLGLWINYGITGMLALLIYSVLLIYCYRKKPDKFNKTALLCLGSIGIFSFFSYPLVYPFVWFIILLCSTFILIHSGVLKLNISIKLKKAICYALVAVSLFAICKTFTRMNAEIKWRKVSTRFTLPNADNHYSSYKKLHTILHNDCYFLYNYSINLFEKEKYEESLVIVKQCRKYWADYDLEMVMAEIHTKLGQWDDAEKHYIKASQMCPNRFLPLYKLALLYKDISREDDVRRIAKMIIDKTVKIDSALIQRMKAEMKEIFYQTTL